MPADLRKQIENHLATYPDRHRELEELKKEWIEFKTRALWTLVGFLAFVVTYGVWIGSVQTTISQNQQDIQKVQDEDKGVQTRLGILEVNNSEIKTRLSSIEATLQEIKLAIKSLK